MKTVGDLKKLLAQFHDLMPVRLNVISNGSHYVSNKISHYLVENTVDNKHIQTLKLFGTDRNSSS